MPDRLRLPLKTPRLKHPHRGPKLKRHRRKMSRTNPKASKIPRKRTLRKKRMDPISPRIKKTPRTN